MDGLFLFVGIIAALNYFVLIKSYLMDLDVKGVKKKKCYKCHMEYSDKNEKASIDNTGKCITCKAIDNGRP